MSGKWNDKYYAVFDADGHVVSGTIQHAKNRSTSAFVKQMKKLGTDKKWSEWLKEGYTVKEYKGYSVQP